MRTVLFACIHNAGRSQMASALFNALADTTKADAISAGTTPADHVHPEVVTVMREVGIDLASARPRAIASVPMGAIGMLVTMGCGDACPVAPGVRVVDWPLDDPKGQPLARVRTIRDDIHARVKTLIEAEGWCH